MSISDAPLWVKILGLISVCSSLLWVEYRWPLRRAVESKLKRNARNALMAAISLGAVQLAELPLVLPLAALAEERGWGILRLMNLPLWMEVALAFLLMDYTIYVWHVLTHRVPWLWRFHAVHHTDLDLDASTALRFHVGELLISIPWRAGQVLLIGVSPFSFLVWQGVFFLLVLFHHSNTGLPIEVERRLNYLIVTPRMHGIHHSIVREETDSNWSSGLVLWDWLHGTLRLNVPQDEITIGVPAYRRPEELTFAKLLKLPFINLPPSWQLPGNGPPERLRSRAARGYLLA